MPRVAGRIDAAKNEAILDAALELLGERGFDVSLEEIARRAGVSKQTIYNHFGPKTEVVRALAARRAASIAAPLGAAQAAEPPERTLAAYGVALLEGVLSDRSLGIMRFAIASASTTPELAEAICQAGVRGSRAHLADFLALEDAAGRLRVPDPAAAAEMYAGMVIGSLQTAFLLGARAEIGSDEIAAKATAAAQRFVRAFGPARVPSSTAPALRRL